MRRRAQASSVAPAQATGIRRGLFGLACLCVLGLTALLGSGASTAGAAVDPCPNAAIRAAQNSTHLPDCRAYEKITPANKNSGNIVGGFALDRDHAYFRATTAFHPDDSFFQVLSQYIATRSANGWNFEPARVGPGAGIVDFSDDYSRQIFYGPYPLTPDDADPFGGSDVFIRDSLGTTRISQGSLGGNSGENAYYAGQSAAGSHVFFETTEHLEPADAARASGAQLYEYVGGQLRVVGLDSDENLVGVGGAGLADGGHCLQGRSSAASNAISRDGSVVFFEAPDPCEDPNTELYARVDGTDTVHVSATQCTRTPPAAPCVGGNPAVFQGADEDGSLVYFSTANQLVDADVDGVVDLYSYDLDTDQLTRITEFQNPGACTTDSGGSEPCGYSGVIELSADGNRLYFQALGLPVPSGSLSETGIYVYDDTTETTQLVAILPNTLGGGKFTSFGLLTPPRYADLSADGSALIFQSDEQLTPFVDNSCPDNIETGRCSEVYRYDYASSDLSCLSCNSTGLPPLHGEFFQGTEEIADIGVPRSEGSFTGSAVQGERVASVVSEDGQTVVFGTFDRLVPSDVNTRVDIYQWHDGQVAMLTKGTGSKDALLAGISPDGNGIFFSTFDQLVPSDIDTQGDFYVARTDGGFSEPDPPPPPCVGDGCRGQTGAPPVERAPSTETFSGPANAKPGKRPRCSNRKIRRKGRCVSKKSTRKSKQANNDRRASR